MTKFNSSCYFFRIASLMTLTLILLSVAAWAQDRSDLTPGLAQKATPSASSINAQPTVVGTADIRTREARIGPGDLVEVRIFGVPEMSQELRVSNAGIILLPLIGRIQAQGLTTGELEQKIAAALISGGFLNDPQVNVSAKELHSAGVSVAGEVGKPGTYPVFGSARLLDLISAAGGLTPRSGRIVTITHRDQPDMTINVDISSIAANPIHDFEVFAGDEVIVTKAGVVYVLGDVARPAGLVMEGDQPITVLQALALSGGAGRDAVLKGARIIRKSPQGIEEVPIPLKEIFKAQKKDVELLAGDVLFIPTSKSQDYWRNAGAILQAATFAAIFRQ
jgi:polysaccharide export outer membrane protein